MKYINPCSSFRVLRAILLVACLFFSIGVHAQDSQRPALVKFATAPIAPYQVVGEGGKLIGSALPVIECMMRNLEIPYTVDVFPWGRAQQNVELGDHDAFFVASQNRVRDSYAQLSEPLFAGTRSWVFRKGEGEDPETPAFKENAFVGTVRGTNMHTMLDAFYGNVVLKDREYDLIQLLLADRLKAVLMTNDMFHHIRRLYDLNEDDFDFVTSSQRPLGVYISDAFIERYPSFMSAFNKSVPACRPRLYK